MGKMRHVSFSWSSSIPHNKSKEWQFHRNTQIEHNLLRFNSNEWNPLYLHNRSLIESKYGIELHDHYHCDPIHWYCRKFFHSATDSMESLLIANCWKLVFIAQYAICLRNHLYCLLFAFVASWIIWRFWGCVECDQCTMRSCNDNRNNIIRCLLFVKIMSKIDAKDAKDGSAELVTQKEIDTA